MPDLLSFLSLEQFLAFLGAGLLVNLAPGADVMLATACGVQGGPRAGMASGLGTGAGALGHVLLAAAGLSALIAAHPMMLEVLRWIGAGYLVWLALQAWRSGAPPPRGGQSSGWRAFRKGALTNMLNPKPILFILAFLPQFVTVDGPPAWQQVTLLGLVFATTGALVTMGYGLMAGLAGRALASRMQVLNRVAAMLFAGMALRLVTQDLQR